MAKFYLINSVTVGVTRKYPGELIDDSVESAANIRAVGGVLLPDTTSGLAAAAAVAQAIRKNGGDPDHMADVMQAAALNRSTTSAILFGLDDFCEVDANGDVGAITANGGKLASDTTPALQADANEAWEISWVASNSDPISLHRTLGPDFDGSKDVTGELWVNSGTTDAATFTVETSWDFGALVSDSASDAATKSATTHKITFTIAAADIPDGARNLTIVLTPGAHTTNAINLKGVALLHGQL